jgi:3-methyladenine DNA glycosylase AlkD
MKPAKKQTGEKQPTASARSVKRNVLSAPASAPSNKAAAKQSAKAPPPRMTLAEAMRELEKAGSAQTRKTYTRHGATEPMFGVSFATLKALTKRIDVDHDLALALWDTGNFDAQNLAVKIVEPARMTPDDLDRWVRGSSWALMCGSYAAMLPAEGPHAAAKCVQWLNSRAERERTAGWTLLGQLAQRDETSPDAAFEKRLAEIERTIHAAPNVERAIMNQTVIAIGCRNAALRKAALAAAKRIGPVEVDRGDTACKTPDAAEYIEKAWAYAKAKGFESPAAQERKRDVPRRRC